MTTIVRIMGTSRFSPGSSPVNFTTQSTATNWSGFSFLRIFGAGVGDIGRAVRHAMVGCQEVSKDRINGRGPDVYIAPHALPGG